MSICDYDEEYDEEKNRKLHRIPQCGLPQRIRVIKPSFHMIATIAAIAEKKVQRS